MKPSRPIIEPIEPQAFVTGAMMEFMVGVRLAQLALQRGTTDSVRDVAARQLNDGNRIMLDIAGIATRKNLPVPASLDEEHERVLQVMSEEADADFDTAYIERTALHHRHAMKLLERGQTIKIPEISALASRALAMTEVRRQPKMARGQSVT